MDQMLTPAEKATGEMRVGGESFEETRDRGRNSETALEVLRGKLATKRDRVPVLEKTTIWRLNEMMAEFTRP
jgi:hypothetical protein